jgi:hypothetical protein
MSEHEENELICLKLLGWERSNIDEPGYGRRWRADPLLAFSEITPLFNDWPGAGVILEALAREAGKYPSAFPYAAAVGFDPRKRDWSAGAGSKSAEAATGPLAIRAAALEYIRAAGEPGAE